MSVLSSSVIRDPNEQEFLTSFLESENCPPHTMNFYQLDGYIRAICVGPGVAGPKEWMPLVFNDKQPDYQDETQATKVVAALMRLYDFHAEQVISDTCDLPCAPVYTREREDRINLEQWARGFMQGYIFWEERWNSLLATAPQFDPDLDKEYFADELDLVLHVIATVADVDLALQQGTHSSDIDSIFSSLPARLISCARIGRVLNPDSLTNNIAAQPSIVSTQALGDSDKVGRNKS